MHPSRTCVPGVFLLAALTSLSGCGTSTGPVTAGDEPSPSETPSQTRPAGHTAEPDLSTLSATDREILQHYLDANGKNRAAEGTWIFAAPMTVTEATTRLLGPTPTPGTEANFEQVMNGEAAAYGILQVGDGVLAYEDTGFVLPPTRLLAALSDGGAVSAVVTGNIDAMVHFGYARDGEVVLDPMEYAFVDDLAEMPEDVRDLAALAWADLAKPPQKTLDAVAVALAMGEKVTGVRAVPSMDETAAWYLVPLPWSVREDE